MVNTIKIVCKWGRRPTVYDAGLCSIHMVCFSLLVLERLEVRFDQGDPADGRHPEPTLTLTSLRHTVCMAKALTHQEDC